MGTIGFKSRGWRMSIGVLALFLVIVGVVEGKAPLIFLTNDKLAPLSYVEDGKVKGLVVDLAYALGKKMGRDVEIIAMDWKEAQSRVLNGEADALLQMNRTSERERLFDFSDPFLPSEFTIFRRDADTFLNGLVDLVGTRVGTEARGYSYHMLKDLETIDMVIVPSLAEGFEKIASGELDAVVVERWIGEYELANSRIRGIHTVQQPVETGSSHIAVKKGNTELLDMINGGLKKMDEDGTTSRILGAWRGKSVIYLTRESIMRTVSYAVMGILAVASLVAFVVVHKLRKLNRELESTVAARTSELQEANEQLRKANEELARITMVDGLTQVHNRRGFDELYHRVWAVSMREAQPLTVIMIDIDEFKSYNDRLGHLVGDQCVRNVAEALELAVRRTGDVVARFGGDEFVVVLFNTSEDGGVTVANNIRDEIAKYKIDCQGSELTMTLSLGVASLVPTKDLDPYHLIELADRALYRAKQEGRNQVVRASDL
jgi:diguanylate cyclase (GGDEF)-like protein